MISIWLAKELVQTKHDYKRVNQSFADSKKELVHFKAVNGKLASKMDVLQFRNTEIENIFPEILEELKNLRVKNRMATQFSETIMEHELSISTNLKDSITEDSTNVRNFDFKDDFYEVKGQIVNDSIHLNINSCDSIIQVVYKGKRKRPWLWIFSKRQLEQVIYSKNPNSIITYSRIINITK